MGGYLNSSGNLKTISLIFVTLDTKAVDGLRHI